MEEKKKGIKVHLLLFLVFFMFAAAFIAWLTSFYHGFKNQIAENTLISDCSSYSFDISEVNQIDDRLMFRVTNHRTSMRIYNLTLEYENVTREITNADIAADSSRLITIDDISPVGTINIYPGSCRPIMREITR